MEEIILSIMRNTDQTEQALQSVLEKFEREFLVHVRLQMLNWDSARREVKEYAIRQRGPDVSVIGTTWVPDLVSMNALLPFSAQALAKFGKREAYIRTAWDTMHDEGDQNSYALPWLVDTYVFHYRKDLFERAGIQPRPAFDSLGQVGEWLGALRDSGVQMPIQLPYHYDLFCTMHTLAAWIWGRGGEFCTPNGKKVLFDQPEALVGISEYFNLARCLSAVAREELVTANSMNLFRQGAAASAFGTLSFMYNPETIAPEVRENWGTIALPTPHFTGGVNLVIWKHSLHEQAAVELMRFLNRPEIVTECARAMLTIPAVLTGLDSPVYQNDPNMKVITDSARSGRSYLPVKLWGLIEERFINALSVLGGYVLTTEDQNLERYIAQTVQSTARRLNLSLES